MSDESSSVRAGQDSLVGEESVGRRAGRAGKTREGGRGDGERRAGGSGERVYIYLYVYKLYT